MPKVSNHTKNIDSKSLIKIYEQLSKAVLLLKNKQEVDLFLSELLTNTEKIMLAKRLVVAMMLKEGYSYAEIGNSLKVSDGTISIISEKMHNKNGFEVILEKMKEDESIEDFFKIIKKNIPKNIFPKYTKYTKERWKL